MKSTDPVRTISEIIIKDPFTMEKDEIKGSLKLIDDECNEIVSSVPKDATELEKVLLFMIISHLIMNMICLIKTAIFTQQ